MVSAVLADALSDPVAVLHSLSRSQSAHETSLQLPARAAAHFRSIFDHENAFKQISPLDVHHPPESYAHLSRPLVRFRAMVQDTSASPEIYPATLADGRVGGWGLAETTENVESVDLQNLRERDVLWAISIPGESPFVAEYLDDPDCPESTHHALPNPLLHKDPLLREKHLGVQIKIYDSPVALKPTELHTFVGFLTFEQASSIPEILIEGPPLPTLHVLFSLDHTLCLLPFAYPFSPVSKDENQSVSVTSVRDELIKWISDEALGGDILAAEWALIASIARVQARQPPLLPPSLTISHFPKPGAGAATPALTHVLRHILPLFVAVPLSLSMLNTHEFVPESRDESLRSGLLQLPAGTTVLVSDGDIQEGNITELGIRNIQALRTSLMAQTLDYRFPFTAPYQFSTDLSFIILTEGKKSAFVETHLYLPLKGKVPADYFKAPENIRLPSSARLDAYRRLVGGAKTGKIHVTEEVSQYIQDDFVRERQQNKAVTADDLMIRMHIARLIALSRHDSELTKEVWHRTKELDEKRKERS